MYKRPITDVKPSSLPSIGHSDHSCVFLPSSLVHSPSVVKNIFRKFTSSRLAVFTSKVAACDWCTMVIVDHLEKASSIFTSFLFSLYNRCFPR